MYKILEIVICNRLARSFDYILDDSNQILTSEIHEVGVGTRVLVPFGSKDQIGFVSKIKEDSDFPVNKLKKVINILDINLIPKNTISVINFASDYYCIAIGLAYKMALPNYLREKLELPDANKKNNSAKKAILNNDSNAITNDNVRAGDSVINNDNDLQNSPSISLNPSQEIICKQITSQSNFNINAINGVTGSGKTLLYMEIISFYLNKGTQALVLIPEINLGPQTLTRFQEKFSHKNIAMVHSKITPKQRYVIWKNAREGKIDIIVGTRSACFIPLKNPGIFIIDEEHDLSFKQQLSPRYSARDLMIKRAQIDNVPIILGSATLSIETWHNIQNNKYKHYELTTRANNAHMPEIKLLDTNNQSLFSGLSTAALLRMQETLDKNQQVMVFINKRGFSPVLYCDECAWKQVCKYCERPMTLHLKHSFMLCHHCEYKVKMKKYCPECKSNELKPLGVGTERLEMSLKEKFNSYNIIRIDKDTSSSNQKLEANLDIINNNKADIIVATQMLAKGHHFPNLTLVVVLNVDQALFSNDYRAIEKVSQLIIQVGGRVGRDKHKGTVLIQSNYPNNQLFHQLINKPYSKLLDLWLSERQQYCLPPYSSQVLIIANNKMVSKIITFLAAVRNELTAYDKYVDVLGPTPSIIENKKGMNTYYLTLQSSNRAQLHVILKQVLIKPEVLNLGKNILWEVEIDPASTV